MKQKILISYTIKVIKVEYSKVDVEQGYQCGCGGDDHELFVNLHQCECFCHGKGDEGI